MSEWDDFDAGKGEEARDKGMSDALKAERVAAWKLAADAWFYALPSGTIFSLDHLIKACGVADAGANRNNVVGAWTSAKARKEEIVFTGRMVTSRRVSRHVGLQRLWRKV